MVLFSGDLSGTSFDITSKTYLKMYERFLIRNINCQDNNDGLVDVEWLFLCDKWQFLYGGSMYIIGGKGECNEKSTSWL